MRDKFDEDPGKFCKNVMHGNICIKASDLPSMIYPEKGYNTDAIDENALKSDLLASCFRALFTGPSSGKRPVNASGSNKKKGSGRNPIAVTYHMKECNKYHVAYVATLAESDGDFDYEEYYNYILTLFDDKKWCEDTLDWYNG
ncbi:uncharacterized protein LAESUDRAFT_765628 [Laetiporus sulphureus 93-53]|uniref:Uncharacterized protein n=1 Tax=Laetiporus sulphureus 93-53 TaxID=1314785 RepID=A0A165ANT7_9APHY|nr:uncharacterized protein LAESUDRAFT_765628 [Laetiporus sulphureus 93-53]KZS99365.1 hypothetical protein LAESUDRAFT_765628 [Laetiporus sulphureus 93-53]